MEIIAHTANDIKIAEVQSDEVVINTIQEGADLLVDLYYQEFDGIIIYAHQLTSDFFDLKTGFAGELLQKFSNSRMRLAIIGDFANVPSKSVRDFIFESNKGRFINFLNSAEESVRRLSSR